MSYDMTAFLTDLIKNDIPLDDQIYSFLSTTDTVWLTTLMSRLEAVRNIDLSVLYALRQNRPGHKYRAKKSIQGQQTLLLGKLLEKIMLVLLRGCKGISVGNNLRSTTSEIDFMVQVKPLGLAIPIFKQAQTHLIGEAKCYKSGFKSEWVNELVGLMQLHNTTHSILFTASPSKVLQMQHRHAIQLHGAKGDRVIPFGLAQVKEIIAGQNFLKVLSDQYIRVLNATSDLAI